MIRSILVGVFFLLVSVAGASAQSCSYPNTLTNGTNADATQVMANFNAILSCLTGLTTNTQQSGRLTYVSATQIKFAPFNGGQIKISGTLFPITVGGITGCSNTSVFLNGAAGQNLAASTLYYVYAFMNSGTMTCDFSTTTHATSATAGNVGTEIKSADDSRSLIGMIRTNASSQFLSTASQIYVVSWFNRRNIALQAAQVNTGASIGSGLGDRTPSNHCEFLAWSDEAVTVRSDVSQRSDAGSAMMSQAGIDGTAIGTTPKEADVIASQANAFVDNSVQFMSSLSEGYHFSTWNGSNSTGNGLALVTNSAMIRG